MIVLLLVACTPDVRPSPPPDTGDTTETVDTTDPADTPQETADTPADTDVAWDGPDHLALPYATVGDPAPSTALNGVPRGAALSTTGPFAAARDGAVVRVSYTGDPEEPALADGALTVDLPGGATIVTLSAVMGTWGIGAAAWTQDANGAVALVELPSAPNAHGATPWTDTTVLIAVPLSYTGGPSTHVVTHLHGFNATLPATSDAQALVPLMAASGRDAVLVVPQGPVNAASGDFGQLMQPGGHADLVRDVISVLYRDGLTAWARTGEQVLTAHSGGYQATAALLRNADLDVRAVHLFDALYADEATFESFASSGGALRSNWTASGGTADNNAVALQWFASHGVSVGGAFTDDLLADEPVVFALTGATHERAMRDERAFARWLAWSGLPFGADATPELRSVRRVAGSAELTWLADGDGGAATQIEASDDAGLHWTTLGTFPGASAQVAAHAWYRLRWVDGDRQSGASDVYALGSGTGPRWLVVDGFDRILSGSYAATRHDFAARVASALARPADAASNEAVARGQVDLGDYDGVLWLLGDEGTADITLDADERAALAAFDGAVILSGSEVGYATDRGWLPANLGATYVSDDAGTTTLQGGRTFGHAYPEDYPDVLSGPDVLWRYDTGTAAAVRDGDHVVVGFPLETFDDATLPGALAELVASVGG